MPPTVSWDETSPVGTQAISLGDDRIRELKTQLREIIDVDHDFPSSGTAADNGQHKKVTLQEQADLGTGAVSATILGSQTVSGKGELCYVDEDDNTIQITSAGYILGGSLKAASVAHAALADDAVETHNVKDANINAAKLATDAVETAKIKDANVTHAKLADDAVETHNIKALNVTTAKIAAANVTADKVTSIFGAYVGAKAINTDNTAPADVIVFGRIASTYTSTLVEIAIGGVNIMIIYVGSDASNYGSNKPFCFPVRKGDIWRVSTTGDSTPTGITATIWEMPVGV